MAFSSLFTLLDDIAALLDDVSIMTKVAAKKTAGVIGDDLALNANQVSGKNISPDRELPIIWRVAKGSFINKAILIPLALLLSVYLPQAIVPLLMVGGAYLCFEGVEKLLHTFLHKKDVHKTALAEEQISEKDKIKGAVRTDFILSAEIIIIALGVLQASPTIIKIISLTSIGVGITVFVYGLVGLIVKLDDIGLWLMQKKNPLPQTTGKALLVIMPWFMKSLSIIGTIAMFLVGGGIFSHNIAEIHHFVEHLGLPTQFAPLIDFIVGIMIGAICCVIILPLIKLLSRKH